MINTKHIITFHLKINYITLIKNFKNIFPLKKYKFFKYLYCIVLPRPIRPLNYSRK